MEARVPENLSQIEQEKFKRKIKVLNHYAVLQLEEATVLNVGFTPGNKDVVHIGMVTGDDLFAKGISIRITIKKGSHVANIVRALVGSADLIRKANSQIVKERGSNPGTGAFLSRVLDLAAALFAAPGILLDRLIKNIKKGV